MIVTATSRTNCSTRASCSSPPRDHPSAERRYTTRTCDRSGAPCQNSTRSGASRHNTQSVGSTRPRAAGGRAARSARLSARDASATRPRSRTARRCGCHQNDRAAVGEPSSWSPFRELRVLANAHPRASTSLRISTRASGTPSASTVESVIACGSGTAPRMAVSSHSVNRSTGSSGTLPGSNAGASPVSVGSERSREARSGRGRVSRLHTRRERGTRSGRACAPARHGYASSMSSWYSWFQMSSTPSGRISTRSGLSDCTAPGSWETSTTAPS